MDRCAENLAHTGLGSPLHCDSAGSILLYAVKAGLHGLEEKEGACGTDKGSRKVLRRQRREWWK